MYSSWGTVKRKINRKTFINYREILGGYLSQLLLKTLILFHFHAVFGKTMADSMLVPPSGFGDSLWQILNPPLTTKRSVKLSYSHSNIFKVPWLNYSNPTMLVLLQNTFETVAVDLHVTLMFNINQCTTYINIPYFLHIAVNAALGTESFRE